MVVTTDSVPGMTCKAAYHYPAVVYEQFASFSTRGDPLPKAAAAALKGIAELAEKYKANAVVSVRIEFGNRTEKDEGRVLVYGTFANCN